MPLLSILRLGEKQAEQFNQFGYLINILQIANFEIFDLRYIFPHGLFALRVDNFVGKLKDGHQYITVNDSQCKQ